MSGRVVVLLLAASLAHAETHVLCAGVEQYDDPRISPLKYAVADARAVAQAFRGAGVARPNVALLVSDEQAPERRPTRINLVRGLQRVRDRAVAGDKLVVFFAGHGIEQGGEQYLLTVDTQADLIDETSLPMRLVNRALEGLQASEVLFLLDACRNDPRKGRGDGDSALTEEFARGMRPVVVSRRETKPRLVATLLACDAGQRAWEDPDTGHGVFTLYLGRGLAGAAAGADGQVRLTGLAGYVCREVGLWAERTKRTQSPRLLNPDGGDMVVLTPPPEPLVSVAFENHTLAQVVSLLAEQYGVQVVLGKGVDATLPVTGRLENQPLAVTLKVLLLAHDLTVRREGGIYIIERPVATPVPAAPPTAPAATPAAAPATADETIEALREHGAFGFPQQEAWVLCDRPELRFSVWNNDQYLFAQAVLWTDGDSTSGTEADGKAACDYSSIDFDADADGRRTPKLDRSYYLDPLNHEGKRQMGLWYTFPFSETTGSGLMDDSRGRGMIGYVGGAAEAKVRVDSYLIPLAELSRRPGDTIALRYYALSHLPDLKLNSVSATNQWVEMKLWPKCVLRRGGSASTPRIPDDRPNRITPW